MAKLHIYTYPDEVLAKKALPVARVEERHRALAQDMLETMYDAPGVGLAANQIGHLERILVMDCDYQMHEDKSEIEAGVEYEEIDGLFVSHKKPYVLINPEIVEKREKFFFNEGCLSVPEFQAEVERFKYIKVKYIDLDQKICHQEFEGLHAVCVQHEIDHLDGKLFIERLSDLKQSLAKKKLIKERAEREAEGDEKPRRDRSRIRRYQDHLD